MNYRRNLAALLAFHREDRELVQAQRWRGISLIPGQIKRNLLLFNIHVQIAECQRAYTERDPKCYGAVCECDNDRLTPLHVQ